MSASACVYRNTVRVQYVWFKRFVTLNKLYVLIIQHLRDFPLYTEAIKFFNHSESMVRIAVRTLTLNVYKGYGVVDYTVIDIIF